MNTTAQKFQEFHSDNPVVYETLVRLSREWKATHGGKTLGIRVIWEVARWEIIKSTKNSDYRLNNNLTGYYARLIMAQESDLAGLFEIRNSPADSYFAESVPA